MMTSGSGPVGSSMAAYCWRPAATYSRFPRPPCNVGRRGCSRGSSPKPTPQSRAQSRSLSTLGVSEVVVQFDLNRNIDSAAQDIQAAITAAGKSLPQSLTTPPTYRKVNPTDPPILILSARSETLPLHVVQENVDNFLIPAISQVSGVARVAIGGDRKSSIRIQVDPAKLAANGLTLEEIRNTDRKSVV